MNRKFDPYEALGVDRGATDEEIRAAARQAAKETHPDAGGDAEAFQETRRALAILTNPKKRKKFDKTGDAEEVEPDNTAAAAMQIIESEIAKLMNAYLMSDFNPLKDPRKMDVVTYISCEIKKQIMNAQSVLNQARKHAEFLRDVEGRFTRTKKGDFNFVARRIRDQIAEVEAKRVELNEHLDHLGAAVEMIEGYEFRKDEVNPFATTVQVGDQFFTSSFIVGGTHFR